MGNLGGGEILVILLVGLLVLGPNRLPEVTRQIGRVLREVRRVSTGFQEELRAAVEDPGAEEAARERGHAAVASDARPDALAEQEAEEPEGQTEEPVAHQDLAGPPGDGAGVAGREYEPGDAEDLEGPLDSGSGHGGGQPTRDDDGRRAGQG